MNRYEFDNESQITSDIEARDVSPTKPRTVSVFFAGVITVGAEMSVRRDELLPFMSGCTLDSVRVSECPAKKCVPSFLTQVSSVISFSAYRYDFRNENNVSVLLYHQ